MTVIAIINIAGATNRRDIIRRLMDASEAFANMTFATAAETFRSYERSGLVQSAGDTLVIYHNCDN